MCICLLLTLLPLLIAYSICYIANANQHQHRMWKHHQRKEIMNMHSVSLILLTSLGTPYSLLKNLVSFC